MNSPDENPLLKEILADEKLSDFRRASLERALTEMRHARRHRSVMRAAGLVFVPLALLMVFAWLRPQHEAIEPHEAHIVSEGWPPGAPSDDAPVKTLSDEELFALFPNRALALIGSPGQQQFVFLDATAHN